MQKFAKFSRFMVFYTLLVILWGAWVRISFSGDGCGDSWPLCDGQVVPGEMGLKTFNEYFHRLTSGLYGIFALILWLWARKALSLTHPARRYALLTFIFTITEALLGAKLVLFGLVTDNDSAFRAIIMAAHLLNSLALMSFVALTSDFAKASVWQKREKTLIPVSLSSHKFLLMTVIGFALIGTSGAIAALSTTLFPSESLIAGILNDFSEHAHFLVKLRIFHPLLGTLLGLGIAYIGYQTWLNTNYEHVVREKAKHLAFMSASAIVIGYVTLITLSPIPLKIVHLSLAHGMWFTLVIFLNRLYWKPIS
jgi:cytochrome c oxidase assembly protein subunit 15